MLIPNMKAIRQKTEAGSRIIYSLANAKMIRPEFHLSYTVKDREASKNVLLGKAVADAKTRAAVLTQAAGVTLKDIQSIDYSRGEIDFEISPIQQRTLCLGNNCSQKEIISSLKSIAL